VLYLNGQELWRRNMPAGNINFSTPQQFNGDLADPLIDPDLLVEGRNVLAVELHRGGPQTNALVFDLAVHATL
jgi:hypothetical protein